MALASPTMLPERSFRVRKRLRLTVDWVWAHSPATSVRVPASSSNAMSAGRRCARSSVSRIQATGREP